MFLAIFINGKKTNRDFGRQKRQKVKEKERSGVCGALFRQNEKYETDVLFGWTN